MASYVDVIVRIVPSYGYLPIVVVDGEELYRGEFCKTLEDAATKGHTFAVKNNLITK